MGNEKTTTTTHPLTPSQEGKDGNLTPYPLSVPERGNTARSFLNTHYSIQI